MYCVSTVDLEIMGAIPTELCQTDFCDCFNRMGTEVPLKVAYAGLNESRDSKCPGHGCSKQR